MKGNHLLPGTEWELKFRKVRPKDGWFQRHGASVSAPLCKDTKRGQVEETLSYLRRIKKLRFPSRFNRTKSTGQSMAINHLPFSWKPRVNFFHYVPVHINFMQTHTHTVSLSGPQQHKTCWRKYGSVCRWEGTPCCSYRTTDVVLDHKDAAHLSETRWRGTGSRPPKNPCGKPSERCPSRTLEALG